MIDYENIRQIIVSGLRDYLGCAVIRSNQNAEPPSYPYCSYTIITPKSNNSGTWQKHDDGVDRKAILQTWSLTFLSDNNDESVELANKANEWLDNVGTTYLNDNDVIIQSVGPVGNRDNILTIEYEYRNGFDVVLWLYDEVETDPDTTGWIEEVTINEIDIKGETYEEAIERLAKRLRGD